MVINSHKSPKPHQLCFEILRQHLGRGEGRGNWPFLEPSASSPIENLRLLLPSNSDNNRVDEPSGPK